jgi:glycerol-3-phosphate dehydrogenase
VPFVPNPRTPLENRRFQVIVIGGGINGVAIARECAKNGRRTLLLEQGDFGCGTTSRSTRIIHGGLRYLEHGELGLVRESLSERNALLRQYPHLIHPLQFLLALDDKSNRGALKIRTGLWLYRRLAGNNRASAASKDDCNKLARSLDAGRKWSVFGFQDAQCEFPERLVAEWLVEAIEFGAVARNHSQVLAIDIRQGKAGGVLIRDQISGKEERVEAGWIVNATGPWADRLCQRSRIRMQHLMVGGVRGSHVVLPLFAGAPDSAVYSEGIDGRPIFVIPWNGQTLVGTTECKDVGDPAKTRPSPDEITYLLQSFNGLFPRAGFIPKDIKHAFAGIRPLPFSPNAKFSAVSRKHYLHDHKCDGAAQMISVIGGKLTTAAELARQCTRKMFSNNSKHSPAIAVSPAAMVSSEDIDPLVKNFIADTARAAGISNSSASGIVEWHGKRSPAIARMALGNAELRAPLCPHTEHIVAEAINAFSAECAITLADVLLRRVPVALGACWTADCTKHATAVLKPVMGWTDDRAATEMAAFEQERQLFLGSGG